MYPHMDVLNWEQVGRIKSVMAKKMNLERLLFWYKAMLKMYDNYDSLIVNLLMLVCNFSFFI